MPFKVERKGSRWVIPSHENHPAEAEDRLVKITGNVLALTRGALQSKAERDHEALGVIDPLDAKHQSLKGRGLRCTLRDDTGAIIFQSPSKYLTVWARHPDGRWRYILDGGNSRPLPE